MTTHDEEEACKAELRKMICASAKKVGATYDIEVIISTELPLVHSMWVTDIQCPHGVRFYFEPTTDQLARWKREGAP